MPATEAEIEKVLDGLDEEKEPHWNYYLSPQMEDAIIGAPQVIRDLVEERDFLRRSIIRQEMTISRLTLEKPDAGGLQDAR